LKDIVATARVRLLIDVEIRKPILGLYTVGAAQPRERSEILEFLGVRGFPKSPPRKQGSISKPAAQAREYFKARRASKGVFQSPPRKQGSISKPAAQARVSFKARRASKGVFQSKQGSLRNPRESNPCWRGGL
jgi:hypothetical protein